VISLNLVLAGLRLGLKNRQVGEKWVSDVCSYLYKGLRCCPLILYDANVVGELEKTEEFGTEILKLSVDMGGTITGEH
jgi:hypothetical protein